MLIIIYHCQDRCLDYWFVMTGLIIPVYYYWFKNTTLLFQQVVINYQ